MFYSQHMHRITYIRHFHELVISLVYISSVLVQVLYFGLVQLTFSFLDETSGAVVAYTFM